MQNKSLNDSEIESLIRRKGLIGQRVTPTDVNRAVVDVQYHQFIGTTTTVCCVALFNGFNVIGQSACADASNFDKEIGEGAALQDANNKIWSFLGYGLRNDMHLKEIDEDNTSN